MAGLDISEKRLPRDGRFSVRLKDQTIDVRLSTMPSTHGESVVMRLLSLDGGVRQLDRIGMPPAMLGRGCSACNGNGTGYASRAGCWGPRCRWRHWGSWRPQPGRPSRRVPWAL